jgi:rhodanese-related sulfurtransferase
MKKLLISLIYCFFVVCVYGQTSAIAGFYLEKMEDVGRWDSIMQKRLKEPDYSRVSLKHFSVDSFEQVITDRLIQLVDVRTEKEYNEGHIPDAILIDIKTDDFTEKAKNILDKDRPVAVYCKGGVRSRRAAEKLLFMGFSLVYNLDAGFDQWKKEGGKIEK